MGLGKTITMIGLIIEKPYIYKPNVDDKNFKYEVRKIDTINGLVTKATLIICPTHLTKQWSSEISKGNPKSKQILILTKTNHEKYTFQDLLDADIVITSFQFLWNINYYVNYGYLKDPKYDRLTKSYISGDHQIKTRFKNIQNLLNFSKETIKNENILFESVFWHRIVVDEAHEIFSSKCDYENVYLLNTIKKYHCSNKWYVSGTPFYDKNSLTNVMNFLDFKSIMDDNGNSHYLNLQESMERGLSESNILNSIFKQIYIRKTKESVKDELPKNNSDTVFVIHQGTKVQLLETDGLWSRIGIVNGVEGWMPTSDFKKL